MDRRRLLLMLAVFVAIVGTALVFLYVRGADNRAQSQYDSVSVLKATQDIAAGETYDDALASGKISLQAVPQNQLNDGYQTSTEALKGKIASVPIFAGQQVIKSQFGNTVQAASTSLPIPKGMVAISVNLTDPDRVAGNIQNGSEVAIFVSDPSPVSTTGGSTSSQAPAWTRLLLPKVTVLNVGSPVTTTSTTTDQSGNQTTEQLPRTLVTVAVTQKEAQKVILSSKALDLTFALLTTNSQVKAAPETTDQPASLFSK
ncbi:MAG: Flp pilus assembly protein CpaB [Nocardioides sp.]|nr:Flp pilus assembly protein CpaB [Nocardioides sp.]MBO0845428.1 Flp pilus assembly protein CpaB [Nocardioides sp.]